LLKPGLSLKDLLVAYDSKLLTDWDHTSVVYSGIYNLTVVVLNAVSKCKAKPKSSIAFHPYREKPQTGMKVDSKGIKTLKLLGFAMIGGR
jgi:hypothetical protein